MQPNHPLSKNVYRGCAMVSPPTRNTLQPDLRERRHLPWGRQSLHMHIPPEPGSLGTAELMNRVEGRPDVIAEGLYSPWHEEENKGESSQSRCMG